jgi:hypothetical protein
MSSKNKEEKFTVMATILGFNGPKKQYNSLFISLHLTLCKFWPLILAETGVFKYQFYEYKFGRNFLDKFSSTQRQHI